MKQEQADTEVSIAQPV